MHVEYCWPLNSLSHLFLVMHMELTILNLGAKVFHLKQFFLQTARVHYAIVKIQT